MNLKRASLILNPHYHPWSLFFLARAANRYCPRCAGLLTFVPDGPPACFACAPRAELTVD